MRAAKSTLAILLLVGGLSSAASAAGQEREHRLNVDASERALTVSESPVLSNTNLNNAWRASGITAEILSSDRLTAIVNGQATTVTPENFAALAVPGRVLFDDVRMTAVEERAPEALMRDDPNATTFNLGWRVITAEGAWDAWGRDRTGLSFDGARSEFIGDFDVALVHAQPGARPSLSSAIPVSITAPGASGIVPSPLEIASPDRWHRVSISVPSVSGSSYQVSLSAQPDRSDEIEMVVSRPTVEISASPGSIVGWGIGTTMITLQVSGMQNPAGYRVNLSSGTGSLSSDAVVLDDQSEGSVLLRSGGQGIDAITVVDRAFQRVAVDVVYGPPWLYLGLAMVGGLAGAFLKGKGREHWVMAFITGAIAGVVMTLLYAVGINWLAKLYPEEAIATGGEAIVFVLGAIGAYVGVTFAIPAGDGASSA